MTDFINLENCFNLLMLIFLQAVLGFDNLLYISIESQRAPKAHQKAVRFWGIIIAVVLRVVLLFVMVFLIDALKEPFHIFAIKGIFEGGVNFSTVIFFFGGIFIIYTAIKEINHMLSSDTLSEEPDPSKGKSAAHVIFTIVLMNLIFSFDSILSALAITEVFVLLVLAILISGIAMLILADHVAEFLEKNRMYEVLGLFVLLIVGIVLLGESGTAAGHAMHDKSLYIKLFDVEILPMSKSTFYFSIVVLFCVEILQTRYKKMLYKKKKSNQ